MVIAVGVTLVGGLGYPQVPSRTYGRSPYAFSATFPTAVFGGKVTVECLDITSRCRTPVFVAWQSPINASYIAWVWWVDGATAMGAKMAKLLLPHGYRFRSVTRDGVVYLVGVPTCGHVGYPFAAGTCSDVVVVKQGKVTWVASAASRIWPTLPVAFVESFRPHGSGG